VALLEEEFTSLSDDVDLDRDRVLVERCQAGDSGAFGNLYARYYERLLRFCLRRLNDRHEAEDAAQEAFARAWKALPNFAGERRFYPWLTVIAGNICTDMLRRRSRSTPTDDLELSSHQQVGGGAIETSEELVVAAVDGELVNKALGRLSVRHRHVLAMREGSGWTYQQIADHEGVEIGTIETLLWRARQALKREFTVLSESKGMLGGFLAGAGALLRRGFLRMAHRSATLPQGGGSGGFRTAMAGMALTSAAVATVLITPHALSTGGAVGASGPPSALGTAGSNLAGPTSFTSAARSSTTAPGSSGSGGSGDGGASSTPSTPLSGSPLGTNPASGALSGGSGLGGVTGSNGLAGSLGNGASQGGGAVSGAVGGVTGAAGSGVGGLAGTISGMLGTVASGLGTPLAGLAPGSGSPNPSGATSTTTTLPLGGLVNSVATTTLPLGGLVNSVATTTLPLGGVVNSLTSPVPNLLGSR
jgi:RNA polymerase sigma-70 factor, ECF subfamily